MSLLPAELAASREDATSDSRDRRSSSNSSSSTVMRQRWAGWRQLWDMERRYLLRQAQDNLARQRQQAQLRQLTDELLGVLQQLEGPDMRWGGPVNHHQEATMLEPRPCRMRAGGSSWISDMSWEVPDHHHHHHHQEAACRVWAGGSSWINDQLSLLADLDLIEPS